MYCKECGEKIVDNSKFCVYCGISLVKESACSIPTFKKVEENIDSLVDNISRNIRKKEMAKYGRLESVDDKDINRVLFSLFGRIAEPLSIYERNVVKLEEDEVEKHSLWRLLLPPNPKLLFHFTMLFLIVGFIFIFIYTRPTVSKKHYQEWSSLTQEEQDKYIDYETYLTYQSPGFAFIEGGEGSNIDQFLIGCVGKAIAFWIVLWMKQIIIFVIRFRQLSKEIKQIRYVLPKMEEQLIPLIMYVPPAYRTSDALFYFWESWQNSRIDNLKEAVLAYDTQNRHMQVMTKFEHLEQTIIDVGEQIVMALEGISNQISSFQDEVFYLHMFK